MDKDQREITFTTDDGEEVIFEILEQTRLAGVNYLLVETSNEDDESVALILKDISMDDEQDAIYDIVEDEDELDLVGKIFNELLEDIDLY